jgi:signal transduction histidine kinase
MHLSVRVREVLIVTAMALLVVGTATGAHVAQLSRVVVEEAGRQAELTARQIYAQSGRTLMRAPGVPPQEALRRDTDLRGLLEAAVGYSPHLLYAAVVDASGRVLLHTEVAREGLDAPDRPTLATLLDDPVRRFLALYRGAETFEYDLPLRLNDTPFGSIRLGVSSTLLRRELAESLRQSLVVAGIALVLAWALAMILTRLVGRRLRALAAEVDRIRRGEFEPLAPALGGRDEFQELTTRLRQLGQEIQADRLATLSDQGPMQQVVDQFEDGVILLNGARRVLFANRAAEDVIGQSLERAGGQRLAEVLPAAHPLVALVDQADADGGGVRNTTLALPDRERSREVLASVFPVREGAARAVGLVVILKDLESVKTVQSLVSYSAKLAALGRLTSGVAHEVKHPLNAMMIHLELLRERLGAPPEDVQQSLEVIGSEIHRLDRVVQGFLRFMRPQELTLKRIDVSALLASLVALLEAEWEPRGVRFRVQPAGTLPEISADEELLRHAFLNILQNACQAMPAGGAVTLTSDTDGRMLRVAIADEGVGISPEDMDKIFRLYYTTKPDGSGIGLALVYRIVQLHDGTVQVRSEIGRGTTVTVTLPVR